MFISWMLITPNFKKSLIVEQFQGNYLKANCIAAQRCHRHYFKLIWESPNRGHKFSPSLPLLSVQNSNRLASRLTTMASFPSVFFQLLQYSRQHPSFSAHWAAMMTKKVVNYPAFSQVRICRFRSSILFSLQVFIPREATLKSSLTLAWYSWTNHNPLLRIATIASFCIDHRWRQMAFFVFVKIGKAPLSRALRDIKQLLCVQR